MKQHITLDQYNQLSQKQKKKLLAWIEEGNDMGYLEPLLTVGQMIAFLHQRGKDYTSTITDDFSDDVCDGLWDQMKKEL